MRPSKALPVLITALWLATTAMLVERHYWPEGPPPSPARTAEPRQWMFEEQWAGIYQQGSKIGYSVSRVEQRPDGYRAKNRVVMKMKVMGVEKEIEMITDAVLDDSFRLRSFVFDLNSDISMRAEGTLEGGELLLTMETGGVKLEKALQISERPYFDVSLTPFLKDLKPGGKLKLPVMELSTLTEGTMEIEALGTEKVTVMGLRQEAMKLKGTYMGAGLTMWINDDGEMLKSESMNLTFLKERQEDAVALGKPSADLIADMAVPSNVELRAGIKYLKLRLGGAGLEGLELDGGVQRQSGDVVEINIEEPLKEKLDEADLEQYLGETLFVQANDPEIVGLARSITERYGDQQSKARALSDWVFLNIKKAPTMTIPSALEVLRSRRGDCNEHTTLFTALARASGIPARIAVGLVHRGGYFYYHAWPEVYLDGWVPVDPTLGQYPADATHLRLLTGGLDRQLRLGSVFGKLRVEALEYR